MSQASVDETLRPARSLVDRVPSMLAYFDHQGAGQARGHELIEGRRVPRRQCHQAFFVYALHQPLADTFLPPKIAHPPVASPGLPWNSWQLPQA